MPWESHHRISRQRQKPLSARIVIFTSGQACAEPPDQQLQQRAGVLAGVDLAGPEVGRQQLVAAEDVQGQEAVMVVIAVEEPPLLMAVHGVVGGVEVEDQMLRRLGVGGDELIDEDLGDPDQGLALDRGSPGGRGSGARPGAAPRRGRGRRPVGGRGRRAGSDGR